MSTNAVSNAEIYLHASLYWMASLLRIRNLGEAENVNIAGWLSCEAFEVRFAPELAAQYRAAAGAMDRLGAAFMVHADRPVGTWPLLLTNDQKNAMNLLLATRIKEKSVAEVLQGDADNWRGSPPNMGLHLQIAATAMREFEKAWGAYTRPPKKAVVDDVQRLRSMSDIDKMCACTKRITARQNLCDIIVSCPHCGRRYLVEGSEASIGSISSFSQLKDFEA